MKVKTLVKLGRILEFVLIVGTCAYAQTTNVSGTFQDPTGQVFANGSYTISFVPTPNNAGPYTQNGVAFNTGPFTGKLSSGGAFSSPIPLADNNQIQPGGSKWLFSLCPNASSPCTQINIVITGATQDISAVANSLITNIVVNSSPNYARAYATSEVLPPTTDGTGFFDVTANCIRIYTQGSWLCISGSGAGGVTSINSVAGPFTFTGSGVSCVTTTCTFTSGGVTSFNSRTGAVAPTTGDYNFNQLSGNIAVTQMNSGTGAGSTTAFFGDGTWKVPSGTGNMFATSSTANFFPKATGSNNYADSALFQQINDSATPYIGSNNGSMTLSNISQSLLVHSATGSHHTVGTLVKITSTGSAALTTSDTNAPSFVVTDSQGADDVIALMGGEEACTFDGANTVGHLVSASSTTAGDCHDMGVAVCPATANGTFIVGMVVTSGFIIPGIPAGCH